MWIRIFITNAFFIDRSHTFLIFPVGWRLCCELHIRKSSPSGIMRPTCWRELKSSAEIWIFFEKKTVPSKLLFSDTFDSFLPALCRRFLTHRFALFICRFCFIIYFCSWSCSYRLAALCCGSERRAGGRVGGCAWAFYDPSSSSFHPVKCLTTINLNSPPWEIASTMRWVLICEGASGWSSVMPRASPTRRQREILI